MTEPPARMRSDAARNRDLLLAAAEGEFAVRGLDASVADIAQRAGVSKATFFRHFTSKPDLIAAMVSRHVTALIEAGEPLLQSPDPGGALYAFMEVAAGQRQQHDVSFLLRAGADQALVVELRDRLYDLVGRLVENARSNGALRADVTATDVILLLCAPNHVVEYLSDSAPELWRRYLTIIFDGLRPEGAHPLPHAAPSEPT